MANERQYVGYPEGFDAWNQKIFDLFFEGVSLFPPELIIGTMESIKMLYISKGIEVIHQPAETNEESVETETNEEPVETETNEEVIPDLVEEPTNIEDIENKQLEDEEEVEEIDED